MVVEWSVLSDGVECTLHSEDSFTDASVAGEREMLP